MTKVCTKCKRELDEDEFNWKFKNIRRSAYCRDCSREYIREHYINNRQYYLNKAKKRNKEVRPISYKFIGDYLATHPCIDCGESDILVLEFDHRDRSTKRCEVTKLVKVCLGAVKAEIAKCDVRCANCHRRKTVLEMDSCWKIGYLSTRSSTG